MKIIRGAMPRTPLAARDPRHGTINGYTNGGCRCDACREACRLYGVKRRAEKRDRRMDDAASGAPTGKGDVGARSDDTAPVLNLPQSRYRYRCPKCRAGLIDSTDRRTHTCPGAAA